MCGIVGVISVRGLVNKELLVKQRDTMGHRGPDSSGIWFSEDGRVGLAHRRLAVIDLTEDAAQPMIDRVTGSVITFNGEIYNFQDVKARLEKAGHVFHSKSDTEVILAAYREWGDDFVQSLSGMFAFAIYDPRRRAVLFARDRAGEKPLFYSQTPNGDFVFASEVKAILPHPGVARVASRASLNEYFAYGYVTGANTMLRDVHRLLPAQYGVLDIDSGEFRTRKYWELPVPAAELAERVPTAAEAEQLTDRLETLLRQSVEQQLVSDVPIGVLLSGGVDSSLVSAIAAQVSPGRIRTFTARFPGNKAFDEGPYARLVAEHIGSEHIELETQPASAELLYKLTAQFDEPIADSSMIPTYLVSSEIRKHATVALGGDGGDELFGGYFRHAIHVRQEELRRMIPGPLRSAAGAVASRVMKTGVPGRNYLMSLGGDAGTSISTAARLFRDDERLALSDALSGLSDKELLAPERIRMSLHNNRPSALQRSTAVDFASYMVDDVIVKVDRASMLASLEIRAPFFDPRVIEFAFSEVPDALRATRKDRKVLLRKLGERLLPPALDLRRKQGFSIPVDEWFRGPWKGILDDAAGSSSALVSSIAIIDYRKQLEDGLSVGERLFTMVILKLWEEHYQIS